MKRIKAFLFIMVLVLSMILPVCTDTIYAYNNSLIYIVGPQYTVIHICHTGTTHKYCEYYSTTYKSCGCSFERYKCCCGQLMPLSFEHIYFCDEHI